MIQASPSKSPITRQEYLSLRRRYEPERIRLVIIAESPPASGLFFYDPTGRPGEPLFKALMLQLDLTPRTKQDGLMEFQRSGWVLVDATYEPADKLDDSSANNIIARDYPLLRHDLESLMPNRSTPLILIKKNVCQILGPKLAHDKFNVLNLGQVVYFPGNGRQTEFHQQFGAIRTSAGI